MRELIIIGAGPAGMTAAVYAARKRIDCQILTKTIGGMAIWTSSIENYMGYNIISGTDLMAKFEEQVKEFRIPIIYEQVNKIIKEDEVFMTSAQSGDTFESKSIIISTGRTPKRLNIPGEKEFVGKGVSYCATCDAPLFKDLDVAVIGGGNSALTAARQLIEIAKTVYIISISGWNADPILQEFVQNAPNAVIYKGYSTIAIEGDDFVQKILIQSKREEKEIEINVRGVFFEIGSEPTSGVVEGLTELTDKGEIVVDCSCRTSVPGLYAAGDVTDAPHKQIIIAAGEGAKAALSAYQYLIRGSDR